MNLKVYFISQKSHVEKFHTEFFHNWQSVGPMKLQYNVFRIAVT
jgi:hypothetical protein